MVHGNCPGVERFKNPTMKEKICPVCGEIIEIFSVDSTVACDNCGFIAYNDEQSCISWCKYAKECFGEELYNKLMAGKKSKEEKSRNEEKSLTSNAVK